MSYEVRVRDWWKPNPKWPDGREPYACPWEKAWLLGKFKNRDEAFEAAKEYNRTHKPGKWSRKAEVDER